jgi:hypothetical protein
LPTQSQVEVLETLVPKQTDTVDHKSSV